MAENDIYHSKERYERIKQNIDELARPASPTRIGAARKYYCRNPENLQYFRALFTHFASRDLSYVRRLRLLQSMIFICNATTKNLATLDRNDINEIMGMAHEAYTSPKSKQTFTRDLRHFWRVLFPETDAHGRPDDTITPYPVRHVKSTVDKSRERQRKDKLTYEEYERVVDYFGRDPRLQAYITLALESLGRPQELLYLRVGNIECFDHYAKIHLSEHGKEGLGLLQCIDSYPYLVKWLNVHPYKNDPQSFLFINTGMRKRGQQLTPYNINKQLRSALKDLHINKPVTCYSLKRNGVTMRRLRGETDMEIQHAARWTSSKQLKTYDLSQQDEAFQRELEKRGIIQTKTTAIPVLKRCTFCNKENGAGERFCQNCLRPLNREMIESEQQAKDQEITKLRAELSSLTAELLAIKEALIPELAAEIRRNKRRCAQDITVPRFSS